MKNEKFFCEPPEQLIADNITFILTDDCNLRCRYCYEKNKIKNNMTTQTAFDGVDYFIDKWKNRYDNVVFDFIGGEPFVRIDLLEKVIPYLIERLQKSNKWNTFVFSFSTNGTCFDDENVRDFIEKYKQYISIGLSLDGCKEIHDYNRSNSFDAVMKNFCYWKRNFPNGSTKSTLNHEAMPYLSKSIKFLTDLPLTNIFMNTVFEDVWKSDDEKIYYDELIKAADYILDNKIYKTKYISLFDRYFLMPKMNNNHNWCGCGNSMIAIDYNGDIFPCLRFKTLSKQKPFSIGNIYKNNGDIDYKKLLPFYFCHNTKNTPDCKNCEAGTICPSCTAFCYDETGSIFDRVNYMCKMHKARYKANIYYWNKMAKIEDVTIEQIMHNDNGKSDTDKDETKYQKN